MSSLIEQQAKAAADNFRKEHKLGTQPLGDLVGLIEQATGYDVAVLEADSDEHGLTMCDPLRGRIFIGIARTRHPMRQRSTLAHELAHLIFKDQTKDLSAHSSEESRADAFARHLLIPMEGVRAFAGSLEVKEVTLSNVVQRFLVSPAIAAIAMREAEIITSGTASKWMRLHTPYLASKYGWSDYYAALQDDSNRLRAPQNLVSRAIAGYSAGVVSAQTIATLRGVSVTKIQSELSALGVMPRNIDIDAFEIHNLPDVDIDLSELEDEELPS